MDIYKYVTASNELATEIAQLLTNEEVKILASEVGEMGLVKWVEWQCDHEAMICDFVASTPSQRKRRKEWKDPVLLRKLVLASVVHCLSAHEFLKALAENEPILRALPYRNTTALAGNAYISIKCTDVQDWPECFEQICEYPFLPKG